VPGAPPSPDSPMAPHVRRFGGCQQVAVVARDGDAAALGVIVNSETHEEAEADVNAQPAGQRAMNW
jgi:hypothetical protein